MKSYVTEEQIRIAKMVDLLSYLQASEPNELKKTGYNEYRTVSHGSLVISNGKWIWNKGSIGGRTALDYLIKVRNIGFVDAVNTVLNSRCAPAASFSLPVEKEEKGFKRSSSAKKLILPERVNIPSKAVKYLQSRGIHSEIISQCLKSGILYEGIYKNPKEPEYDGTSVCVFIGKDDCGNNRFAALRGINTDLKRDASGSDKRFGFTFPSEYPNNSELAVFESPIDLLSHAVLAKRGFTDFTGHRLSLGGTADTALMSFLERNPKIRHISLCLDNDEAGRAAAKRMFDSLGKDERYADISMEINYPEESKDYNDVLLNELRLEREQKITGHYRKDVVSL